MATGLALIKNTFVHIPSTDDAPGGRQAALRRWATDPEGRIEPAWAIASAMPASGLEEEHADEQSEGGKQKHHDASAAPPSIPTLFGLQDDDLPPTVPCTPEPSPRQWASSAEDDLPPTVPSTPEPSPRQWASSAEDTSSPTHVDMGTPLYTDQGTPLSPLLVDPGTAESWQAALPQQPLEVDAIWPQSTWTPGVVIFCFQLRLHDALGLDLNPGSWGEHFTVVHVLRGGAVEAWNRQCWERCTMAKMVYPGDVIVSMNSATKCEEMLKEIKPGTLLKLVVARRDVM